MFRVTHIVKNRQRRSTARRQPAQRAALNTALSCSALVGLALALASILAALAYTDLTRDLPSIETLPVLLEPPDGLLLQPTRLYDRSGEHVILALQNPAVAGAQYLYLPGTGMGEREQGQILSSALVTATLAYVDPGFWQHPGFSLDGLRENQHPTLAQRLVNELLLADEPAGLRRGLRERLLAAQVTWRFGQEKVLEWYLNSANYGRLAYGADAAARLYLGKPATQLSLAEAALLVAIPEAPALNPLDTPQAALERQKYVFQALLRQRTASPDAVMQALDEQLNLRQPKMDEQGAALAGLEPDKAPAFSRLVLKQLSTHIPLERIERGGLRIITTLDYDLQMQATCAAAVQLGHLQEPQEVEQTSCEASRLLPTLPTRLETPLDGLRAEALVLDPHTGQILALAGEALPALEATPLSAHPVGSLATPFIYLAAFTRGLSPASLVWDIPSEAAEEGVANFDGQFHGPMRLRTALANDTLTPAWKTLAQVGVENTWRITEQLGLATPKPAPTEADADLFPFRRMNLVEVSQAFGVFANQGVLAGRILEASIRPGETSLNAAPRLPALNPVVILRVEGEDGKLWLDWQAAQTRPIITPQLAYLMTNVLSDETARWPSLGHPNALEVGRPAAAKSGRSLVGESSWTVGYTAQLVVGAWVGTDSPGAELPQNDNSSAALLQSGAAGLWHALVQYTHRELPYQAWSVPTGISNIEVCDPSGMLPTQDCPNIVSEVFLPGNEPLQADSLYRSIQVNRETGRLATIFSPPELLQEQVYLVAPPQAAEWARQTVLDSPPEAYDVVPAQLPEDPQAMITQPGMFARVRGLVEITGLAAGEGFDYYRLQAGAGLNPHTWLKIGEDASQPVETGQLGAWDTGSLNGLYAIQLLVVHKDRSLERHTILVTVDNRSPEVEITYPVQGAKIELGAHPVLVFQIAAQDELGLEQVQVYLDGSLLGTLIQAPYALAWEGTKGEHTLRVVAVDLAGNVSVASVTFKLR